MKKKEGCDDLEECVTAKLLEAGHGDMATKVFLEQASEFIKKDWPAWKAEVRAQIADTDKALRDHIAREDGLAGAYAELMRSHSDLTGIVERHNDEADRVWKPMISRIEGHMTRVDNALYGEEMPDGSRTDGLVNMRRWLCRVARAVAWVAGAFAAVVSFAIAVGHAAGWW